VLQCDQDKEEEKATVCGEAQYDEGIQQGGADLFGEDDAKNVFFYSLGGDDYALC
jgi:hypothetical protein